MTKAAYQPCQLKMPAGDIRKVADLSPVEHLDVKPPVDQVRQAWCVGIFGSDMERLQRLWARVAARHGADTLKDQPPKPCRVA